VREAPEDEIRQSAEWKNIQHRLPLPIYSTQSGYDLLFIASMVARFAAYCTQPHGSVADGSPTRLRPDTPRRLDAASRLVSAALLVSIEKDTVHPAVADIVSNLLTEAERGRRAAVARGATGGDGTTADGCEQGAADGGASPPAALAGIAANVRPPSPVLFLSPAAPVEPILLFYPRLALRSRFLSFATLSSESALALVERLLRCATSPSAVVDSALSLADLTAVRQMLVENVDALVSFASPEAPRGSEEVQEDAASSQGGGRDGDGRVPPRGVANGGEDGTAGAPGHPVPSAVDAPPPSLADGPADGKGESTTSATPGAGGAGDGVAGNVLPGVEPLVLKRLLTRTSAVLGTLAVVVSTGSARQRAFVRAMALDSPTSPVRRVLPLSLGAVWHESPPLEVVLRARATRLLLLVADGGDGGGRGSAWSDGGYPVGGSSGTSGAAGAPVVAMEVAAVDAPPPAPPVASTGPTDTPSAAVDAVMAAAAPAGAGPDGAATTTAPAAAGAAGASPTSGEPQRPATPVDTSFVTPPP